MKNLSGIFLISSFLLIISSWLYLRPDKTNITSKQNDKLLNNSSLSTRLMTDTTKTKDY